MTALEQRFQGLIKAFLENKESIVLRIITQYDLNESSHDILNIKSE
jgi:hypothetical protein